MKLTTSKASNINFLSQSLPLVSEHEYLDYTDNQISGIRRRRCLEVGCNVNQISKAIGNDLREPVATIAAINESLKAGAGQVYPLPGNIVATHGDIINMQDSTSLDMSRVLVSYLNKSDDFILADEKENFAVTSVTVQGNSERCYAFRAIDSRRFVVQVIKTEKMDRDSISLGYRCEDVTVRYCRLRPGRQEDGNNGAFRNQHGIVSSSIPGAKAVSPAQTPSPSKRFGIVYSSGHTYYSNKIEITDGLSINSHASNLEVMGNYTVDSAFGHKYPHSANVMVHHNFIGNNRLHDMITFRLYAANDYAYGVGYENDAVFVFENLFDNLSSNTRLRTDLAYGSKYFLNNRFTGRLPFFIVTQAENASPGPYNGRLIRHGVDSLLNVKGKPKSSILSANNFLLQNSDHVEMARLMNLPKNAAWKANVEHPLPKVKTGQ